MARNVLRITAIWVVALAAIAPAQAQTKTLARCGAGFLEEIDGYRVLHVKGEPYEMGYQQGALLREDIRENIRFLFEVKAKDVTLEVKGMKLLDPKRVIQGIVSQQRKFIPERFFEEIAESPTVRECSKRHPRDSGLPTPPRTVSRPQSNRIMPSGLATCFLKKRMQVRPSCRGLRRLPRDPPIHHVD